MIAFWLVAACVAAGSAYVLIRPLLQRRMTDLSRGSYDLMVYQDQLREVDQDAGRGLLTEAQANAARIEIQRRMLATGEQLTQDVAAQADDAPSQPANAEQDTAPLPTKPMRRRWAVIVPTALFLPIGGVILYGGWLGSPGVPDVPLAERSAMIASGEIPSGRTAGTGVRPPEERPEPSAEQMAEWRAESGQLLTHLEQNPDDTDSIVLLSRLQARMGAMAEATALMERAVVSRPGDAALLSELGQAMVREANGSVTAAAESVFYRALEADRYEPRSRFLIGLAQVQRGNPAAGLSIWRDLSNETPDEAPWRSMLFRQIAEVATAASIPPISIVPRHPLDPAMAVSPTQTPPDATGDATAGDQMRAEADAARSPGEGFNDSETQMVADMVDGLASRLEENPQDPEGWFMLGRSYLVLDRPAEAVSAFEQAVSMTPEREIEPRRQLAHALIAVAEQENQAEPPTAVFDLMERILATAPNDGEALFFVGLNAAMSNRPEEARDRWEQLLGLLPMDSPLRGDLQARINRLPAETPSTTDPVPASDVGGETGPVEETTVPN